MRMSWILIFLVAVAITERPGLGEQDQSGPDRFFDRLDVNRDGQITLQEVPVEGRMLVEFLLDAAGKGKNDFLRQQDLRRLVFSRRDQVKEPIASDTRPIRDYCPACALGLSAEYVFKRLDANADRLVTVTEFRRSPGMHDERKSRQVVERLDKTGDTQLSWEEFQQAFDARHAVCKKSAIPAARQSEGQNFLAWVFLLRNDKNGDGKVDFSEYQAGPTAFRWLDRDGDGRIDLRDFDRSQRDD